MPMLIVLDLGGNAVLGHLTPLKRQVLNVPFNQSNWAGKMHVDVTSLFLPFLALTSR